MLIFPETRIKKEIAELNPGELVRYHDHENGQICFAFVGTAHYADRSSATLLFLFLKNKNGAHEPFFIRAEWGTTTFLSYGTSYFIICDDRDDAIDIRGYGRGETNGAIVVVDEAKLLRARPYPGQGIYAPAYLDLNSYVVGDGPRDGRSVAFLRWRAYAGTPEQRRPDTEPLITFDATAAT